MPEFGKTLGWATLVAAFYGVWLLQRILPRLLAVAAFALASVMMLLFLILSALFAVYTSLVASGLAAPYAMLIIIGILFASTGLLFAITLWQTKRLRNHARLAVKASPVISNIAPLIIAFLEGFSRPRKK